MEFLIGQRVVYSRSEIVVVIDTPRERRNERPALNSHWVRRANGVEQCVAMDNLSALPNGQL